MNPRELLARLNVPAVRYDIGRGGIPELTNVEIAGALGMIRDEFARDVFCVCWWPDGTIKTSSDLGAIVLGKIMVEYARREREAVAARLELNIAQCAAHSKSRITETDRNILQACENAVSRASAQCWKWDSAAYARMFSAVIKEIRSPRHCWDCRGRGEVLIDALKQSCPTCLGSGKRPHAKKARAQEIKVTEKDYQRGIGKAYEWTYSLLKEAEERAASSLAAAISRSDEVAA